MKSLLNDWRIWGVASLTLGLAPFTPEPHLWGKIKWIAGGAVGMSVHDWFDAVLHATPWVLFVRAVVMKRSKSKRND